MTNVCAHCGGTELNGLVMRHAAGCQAGVEARLGEALREAAAALLAALPRCHCGAPATRRYGYDESPLYFCDEHKAPPKSGVPTELEWVAAVRRLREVL